MKRYKTSLAAILILTSAAGAVSAQDKGSVGKSEYFPLEVDTRWEYSTKAGKISTQVMKHEDINGVRCARIEATLGGNKKSSEYVRATADGIYRHQASDQTIDPPLRFLMLPFKEGATWDVKSKTLGLTVKGTYTISIGTVEVPAGTFKDVLICKTTGFMIADKKVEHTCWFAKGVGMVKQVVNFGGQEMTLVLERFTPGTN